MPFFPDSWSLNLHILPFFHPAECSDFSLYLFIFHCSVHFFILIFFSSQTAECFDSEIAEIFGPSPIGITIILIFYLSSWNCEACKKCLNSYNPKRQIDLEIRNMLVFFSCYLHVYAFTGLFWKSNFQISSYVSNMKVSGDHIGGRHALVTSPAQNEKIFWGT